MRLPRLPGTPRFQLLWGAGVAATALLLWVLYEPRPVDLGKDDPDALRVPAACERFGRALPDELGSLERRDVAEGTPPGWAAYGDPMAVVRCGVPVYTRYQPGDELIVINDVAWDIDEQENGGLRCALPRAVLNIEVSLPPGAKAELLSLLTDAVKQAQPL